MTDYATPEKQVRHRGNLPPSRRFLAARLQEACETRTPIGLLQARAGNRAVSFLLGNGMPLADGLRDEMEARFGTSFQGVRVHDDPEGHAAAAGMTAKAFTHCNDVVFGRGRFAPASSEGRRLLAHELAHVLQQRRGGAPPSLQSGAANEVAADRAATDVVRGTGPVAVEGGSGVGVARSALEVDDTGDTGAVGEVSDAGLLMNQFRRAFLAAIVDAAGYVGPGTVLVAKANEGISDQLFQELWVEGKGKALLLKLAGLGPGGVAQAFAGYNVGLVEGMVSPVTDLFGLAVFGESVRNLSWSLLQSAYNSGGEIGSEVQQLLAASGSLAGKSAQALKALANDPEALKALLALEGAINQFAEQKAYELGKAGASTIVTSMESPWTEAEDTTPAPELGLTTAFAWMQSKAGALHDWAMSTPGLKIGEKIGYAVGWVAIQVILIAFTAGAAGLVEAAGAALSKFGAVLARISTGIGTAASRAGELVVVLGRAIGAVEQAMGFFVGKALQPLAKFLAPVLDPLKETFDALLALLRKLLGVSQRQSGRLVGKTGQLVDQAGPGAPRSLTPSSAGASNPPQAAVPRAGETVPRPQQPRGELPNPTPERITQIRQRFEDPMPLAQPRDELPNPTPERITQIRQRFEDPMPPPQPVGELPDPTPERITQIRQRFEDPVPQQPLGDLPDPTPERITQIRQRFEDPVPRPDAGPHAVDPADAPTEIFSAEQARALRAKAQLDARAQDWPEVVPHHELAGESARPAAANVPPEGPRRVPRRKRRERR